MAVVIPVGPNLQESFVEDTLASIDHYANKPYRLVIVDDSRRQAFCQSLPHAREATVVLARTPGPYGALYANLSKGFLTALEEPFDILMKIDTDALVIGSGFEPTAAEYFRDHPSVGCLGPHNSDYDGAPDNASWAREQIIRHLTTRWRKTPRTSLTLTRLVARARRHGYRLGESVDAGVCLYSRRAIETLHEGDLLGDPHLARAHLHEDYLFGLALRSCGMELSDFGSQFDTLPIGSKWRGLAAAPEDLVAANKALIHSVRFWQDMDEEAIRRYFAEKRAVETG